jgi:hypothetical protein
MCMCVCSLSVVVALALYELDCVQYHKLHMVLHNILSAYRKHDAQIITKRTPFTDCAHSKIRMSAVRTVHYEGNEFILHIYTLLLYEHD